MFNAIRFMLSMIFIAVCFSVNGTVSAQVNDPNGKQLYAYHMQESQGTSDMPFVIRSEEPVVTLKADPSGIAAGKPETITISVNDAEGKPIKELAITHERIMHVVIASKDFTIFSHIHPEDFGPITAEVKEKSQYNVKYTFPKAGAYIIGIDFAVKDSFYSRHFQMNVAGEPKLGAAVTDLSRQKKFSDYDVLLKAPEVISAGKETTLSYNFSKDGKPVTDLEPYLSAAMHASIISADLNDFIHEHGTLPGMEGMSMHGHHMHTMSVPANFGPEINLSVIFPSKGVYEIFGEVAHKGKVIVTKFMVEVK